MPEADFLALVISDGMEAARHSYARPSQRLKLEGALQGYEDCRGLDADGLAALLASSARRREQAMREGDPRYFFWRCREAEVEWVCNVLSAAQRNQGLRQVSVPTARGLAKAAEILGLARQDRDGT